jgi:VanZ family protein
MPDKPVTPPIVEKPGRSRWPLVCLGGYWLVLCAATHWPNPWPAGGTPQYPDKLVHFTAYGILAFLAVFALGACCPNQSRRACAWRSLAVLAAVIAYGLLDEFTQPWTGRDFDWFDWAADIGGATCGAAISLLLMKKRG